METSVKLLDSELTTVSNIQQQWNELTKKLGELYYQKNSIDILMSNINNALEKLNETRLATVKQLQEKYGSGEINLSTGTFIPDVTKTQ